MEVETEKFEPRLVWSSSSSEPVFKVFSLHLPEEKMIILKRVTERLPAQGTAAQLAHSAAACAEEMLNHCRPACLEGMQIVFWETFVPNDHAGAWEYLKLKNGTWRHCRGEILLDAFDRSVLFAVVAT